MTIEVLAQRLAIKMAGDYNDKFQREHLTAKDHDMFERIFESIRYNEEHPRVTYQEHFSLLQGWKPNHKVLPTKSTEQRRSERILPSLVRPSRI